MQCVIRLWHYVQYYFTKCDVALNYTANVGVPRHNIVSYDMERYVTMRSLGVLYSSKGF